MSNQFNLKRFGMLFKKHTVEHYKTYLMSLAVLVGIMILVLSMINYSATRHLPQGAQVGCFAAFLLLGGTIFTSTVFADLSSKKSAIASLTLPASHFEKFLVGWLYSYVIFQVLFVAAFYAIVSVIINSNPLPHGADNQVLDMFAMDHFLAIFGLLYAMLHAACLWGAIFFEKLHFIKTAFSLFLLMIMLALINKPIMASVMHQDVQAVLWSPVGFAENGKFYNIQVPERNYEQLAYFGIVLAIVLWTTAYYRLTEKEI